MTVLGPALKTTTSRLPDVPGTAVPFGVVLSSSNAWRSATWWMAKLFDRESFPEFNSIKPGETVGLDRAALTFS